MGEKMVYSKNKLFLFLVIFSFIYYIPYLLFNWLGAAGIKISDVPIYYVPLQLGIPLFLILLYKINIFSNRGIKLKLLKEDFLAVLIFILLLLKFPFFFHDSAYIRLTFFWFLYISIPILDLNNVFRKKYYLRLLFFVFLFLLLEMFILPKFNIINPFNQGRGYNRYIANLGGPNLLGAFGSYIFALMFLNNKIESKKYRINTIYFMISSFIVISSASISAFVILVISIIIIDLFLSKGLFKKYLKILSWGLILSFFLFIIVNYYNNANFLFLRLMRLFKGESGSAARRLIFLEQIKSLSFAEHLFGSVSGYIKSETLIFQIYLNHGIITIFVFLTFVISKLKYLYVKTKINKKYYYIFILFILVMVHSLVNPILISFPYYVLMAFLFKVQDKKLIK